MLRTFGRRWATDLPRTGCLLIRPYFSKGRALESRLKRPSAPCPETSSRTALITTTAALAIIQAWPSRKMGSQSLGFGYPAPLDETMLQLNPIING